MTLLRLPDPKMWTTYFSAAILIVGILVFGRSSRKAPVPPGPKPLPLIGNLHQLPLKAPFKTYQKWAATYGPIVYMRIFGREFVILTSLKVITEMLEKRNNLYSTRPRLVMAGELVDRDQTSVLFLKYGPRLKQCRQILHAWLNQRAARDYHPYQTLVSYRLLAKLIESPENFSRNLQYNVGSLLLKFAYGIETKPENDPWITMSEQLTRITAVSSEPGRWLVDSFPFLRYVPRWLPGTYFLEYAEASKKIAADVLRLPYEFVEETIAKGVAEPSWLLTALQADGGRSKTPEERDILMCTVGSLYEGGIDTIISPIRTFILMMTRHPDIQLKAQAEIDRVVGHDRLPTMEDRELLPYVEWIIKETFRINAIVPLIPHSLDEDDVYNGYLIPKGAWVMANVWAIFNDPSNYPEPERFNPERFEDKPGHPAEPDPTVLTFGIGMGRRFCPAYHLAMSTIYLNISQILSVFNITPDLDENGHEIIPPVAYDVAHLSAPSPFKCRIKPRNEDKVRLVEHSIAAAERAS